MTLHRIIAASLLAAGIGMGAYAAAGPAFAVPGASQLGADPPRVVLSSSGRLRHVVANPNSCAPFQSMPVWGPGPPGAAPLGYRCYHNPNGS